MIRVVVVDDHPALRAGLQTVLDSEPGIIYAGESNGDDWALPAGGKIWRTSTKDGKASLIAQFSDAHGHIPARHTF